MLKHLKYINKYMLNLKYKLENKFISKPIVIFVHLKCGRAKCFSGSIIENIQLVFLWYANIWIKLNAFESV